MLTEQQKQNRAIRAEIVIFSEKLEDLWNTLWDCTCPKEYDTLRDEISNCIQHKSTLLSMLD